MEKESELETLRQRMIDAHPDKGGTKEEFIKARIAYERAKVPHERCFYCGNKYIKAKMKYLGTRVYDPYSHRHDNTVYSCEKCLDKRKKLRS